MHLFFYNFRRGLTQQHWIDELQFLAMKLHQGPVIIDCMVNSTEGVVHTKTNFVKVVQNQLLFRKPLMLCASWYCKIANMAYREIEATLGISGTSIHSILHEHLTDKKICSRWIPHNLSIAQKKKACVDWSKEILQRCNRDASKHVYDIVTGDESWIYAHDPKLNSSRLYGCFKVRIQQKLLVH